MFGCAGGDNELRVGLLGVRNGPQRRSPRQGRRGGLGAVYEP